MKRKFKTWGYRVTMRGDWIGNLFARAWFRWYCPHPIIDDWSASACITAGECGCVNGYPRGRHEL